jgi:hypothetical protein
MLTGKYLDAPASADDPNRARGLANSIKKRGRMDEPNWGRTLYRRVATAAACCLWHPAPAGCRPFWGCCPASGETNCNNNNNNSNNSNNINNNINSNNNINNNNDIKLHDISTNNNINRNNNIYKL